MYDRKKLKDLIFVLFVIVTCVFTGCTNLSEKVSIEHPITCTVEIRCDDVLNHMDVLSNPGLAKYIPEDGIILPETEVIVEAGSTVYDVLTQVTKDYNIQMEAQKTPGFDTYYIQGMNHLYEKNAGQFSGWLFYINEEMPEYGCSKQIVEDNDKILWEYTCSY